ncbi:hypothetical protein PBI_SCTP2_363 [Salicola phage SCTP-2]|nr:hypothetical protein PBI_SCTP2_363 [Salicola phage SCTP-2]
MTIRKHLDMINNIESEQLNESFNKGDTVKVKDDVKNPQIKKFAGKQAKVLSTEDDGKTIHAKVKGAKHGSMEFKSSELEKFDEENS